MGSEAAGALVGSVSPPVQASAAKLTIAKKISKTTRISASKRRKVYHRAAALLPRVHQFAEFDEGLVADAALDGYAAGRDSQFQLLDDLWAAGGGAGDG